MAVGTIVSYSNLSMYRNPVFKTTGKSFPARPEASCLDSVYEEPEMATLASNSHHAIYLKDLDYGHCRFGSCLYFRRGTCKGQHDGGVGGSGIGLIEQFCKTHFDHHYHTHYRIHTRIVFTSDQCTYH